VPSVVIDNPILNSPFVEPTRHFRFSDDGITDEVVEGRRESGYFLPIASPRKKSGQMKFDTEWTQDRFFSSPRINRIRERVNQWRQGGYVGVTRTTLRLLEYWSAEDVSASCSSRPARKINVGLRTPGALLDVPRRRTGGEHTWATRGHQGIPGFLARTNRPGVQKRTRRSCVLAVINSR
jgi:hypothetical protein